MKIKHYDHDLEKWVIDGASNASNIELTNPAYTDADNKPISTDQGFTKIANKLQKIEDNLAWIYINGAHGGGGGPGGGIEEAITIELPGGDTVYTSTGSVTFDLIINNGTVSRAFDIVIKDVSTGKVVYTTKKYSLTTVTINVSEITENSELEISAVDAGFNQAIPKRISIIYGAISLDLQQFPGQTIDRGGITEVPITFTLKNQIYRGISDFIFKINGITIEEETGITVGEKSFRYSLRDILFNSGIVTNPKAGQKYSFEAYATTALNNDIIKSKVISFNITVVESDKLTIVAENIGEEIENPTEFSQSSQLKFEYYLSFAPRRYTAFNVNYKIYLMDSSGPIGEPLVDKWTKIDKGVTQIFSVSTVGFPITGEGEYIMVELDASADADPSDTEAQDNKKVYATIVPAKKIPLRANNKINTLLAYYSNITGFPATSDKVWNYELKRPGTGVPFPYDDVFFNQFPNGVNLVLNKTNNTTTGFINTVGPNGGTIPGIVLNGESYANLEVAKQMFPDYDIGEHGFFNAKGFNISLTYKTADMSDTSGVVMSIGRYFNDELASGIEITLDTVNVRIGVADALEVKLPVNELITVDIDVSRMTSVGEVGWYFKVYVNGILSAVTRVNQSSVDWMFEEDLYFGCRNDKGILSNFSSVTIYDIKLYTSSQTEFAIVQNYISATEQASLINGEVDESLDNELRSKNLINESGDCLIWNDAKDEFYDGESLYSTLIAQMEVNTPYPIVMIRETSTSPTNFKAYSTATFTEEDKEKVMNATFGCKVTFSNRFGEETISTPSNGVSEINGVRIGLQGTSSLSYNAKNFELYMGDMDETGKKQLFLPIDEWLPENRFTLKADVMDSAHVNNVVVGKIINGEIKNDKGEPIRPLGTTPPMTISNTAFPSEDGSIDPENAEYIRSRIKNTSDGFPCLVFIEYAPDDKGINETKFMGIYNFNLGRHAHFNLGLKILENFKKRKPNTGPSVIESYSENVEYWNKGADEGVHSFEINQNHSEQGAFQQDHESIIRFMADSVYTSRNEDQSYRSVQRFYNQMANMVLTPVQKYAMDAAGQTPTREIAGEFYNSPGVYYTFEKAQEHLNWESAIGYYMIILIFGMVDSVVKNLTIRNWGKDEWYPAFYDMDTAFGLNNAGQDVVEYWAHLHKYRNIASSDTGITSITQDYFYPHSNIDNVKQYYAAYWNRIWEVVEQLPIKDPGNAVDKDSLEKAYIRLRESLFSDPEEFINKHYKSYTDQTGAIMFNYDYKIKYLKIAQTYTEQEGYKDSTDFSQLKFLHGNRVVHVKDWFRKRILFFDGIYGMSPDGSTLPVTIDSPVNKMWANNKSAGRSESSFFGVTMKGTSKILYRWAHGAKGNFWIDERDTVARVPYPGGEIVVAMYANKYITKFENFKNYLWTSLTEIDLPVLEELDLSGTTNIEPGAFLNPTVSDGVNGLAGIQKLNLSGLKFKRNAVGYVPPYTLDVSNCYYLRYLDVSYSDVTTVRLSKDATVLNHLNLSGTKVIELNLDGQSFLTELLLDGCDDLVSVTINDCNSLENLSLPRNVKTLTVTNCTSLSSLNIPYTSTNNSISGLIDINIDNCPGLRRFDITGQNNPILNVSLVGAKNLEDLILVGTKTDNIILPSLVIDGVPNFVSLKNLDISNTNITNLVYNNMNIGGVYYRYDYLDLTNFPDLESIRAYGNTAIETIKCLNSITDPVRLSNQSFYNCSNLKRIHGHILLTGIEIFKGCSSFILNDPLIYEHSVPETFLLGDAVTNVSIDTSSLRGMFENCSQLSYNDFKKISWKLNSSVLSLEGTFKGCSSIDSDIWRDYFSRCRKVETIKDAFSGTRLTGIIYSSSPEYSELVESTWGFFDFAPNLKDAEAAFEGSLVEWIDNNLFKPKNGVAYSIVNIDKLFRNCGALQSAENTWATSVVNGRLDSKYFFSNLHNLLAVYPKNVFQGTKNVEMDIINEGNNSYLFHTDKVRPHNILNNSLYDGVKLIGEIKVNVFGGVTNELGDFIIPKFTSIQNPFANTGDGISVCINDMELIFRNIGETLQQAIRVFSGMNCVRSTVIPDEIFKGCSVLNSISGIFSNLDIDNDGEIYNFPNDIIFKDTVSLRNIDSIFESTNKIRINLLGEGFKNCILEDVSSAFASSGIFGTIPYRLFFMEKDNKLRKTIKKMDNVFSKCWLLGYSSDRTIDEETILETIVYDENYTYTLKTTWNDGIPDNPGSERLLYKLDVSKMVKTTNYSQDDRLEIPNPDYDPDEEGSLETIPNPMYDPGETHFDSWYLDGYGWEGAMSAEPGLDLQKNRLNKYFKYDTLQKQALLDHLERDWTVDGYQNYAIPTDLFRYCHADATLENVLNSLSWKRREIEWDLAENKGKVVINDTILDGLVGRIPVRLFENLVDTKKLNGVFMNTNFGVFQGLIGTDANQLVRGIMYPIDLFKFNTSLEDIPNMFNGTYIPVGVDINSDLFAYNGRLRNISGLWANTEFDNRRYGVEQLYPEDLKESQINFTELFKASTRITNASNLFAVTDTNLKNKGLKIIESTLLETARNINDISGMFYYNTALIGEVPKFESAFYTALNAVSGYLTNVPETNISNSLELEPRLIPQGWSNYTG